MHISQSQTQLPSLPRRSNRPGDTVPARARPFAGPVRPRQIYAGALRSAKEHRRLPVLLGTAIFLLLFQWSYRELIAPTWASFGFRLVEQDALSIAVTWVAALSPVFWMPIRIVRPSQVLYWLLYVTVYVPSIMVPYYVGIQTFSELLPLTILFVLGFYITGVNYHFPLPRPIRWQISRSQCLMILAAFYVILMALFLSEWWPYLRLVSFSERYDVRLANRDVSSTWLAEYSRSWLASVLTPLLLTFGLLHRRALLIVAAALTVILLYSSAAARVWVLAALYVPIGYYVLRQKRRPFGTMWLAFTSALFTVCIALQRFGVSQARDLADLFVLRIYANPGFFTAVYAKFFSDHPLTYGAHLKGVNLFVDYPYEAPVQYMVGHYLAGSFDMSANAHMWAGDGIASFGLIGILVISVLLALVFFLIDWCGQHLDIWFVGLVVSVHYANLSNIPLLSSMLGGGLALTILLFWIMPSSILGRGPRKVASPTLGSLSAAGAPSNGPRPHSYAIR